MPSIYRKEWTGTNGWEYTLDIIPYDADWDDTAITLSAADAHLVEVGEITHKFDDLPIGLATPSGMTMKVVINRLPSALQTYLRTKQSGTARNTFVLRTNAGSVGGDVVLFCGVQSKINSTTYVRENGNYIVELELVDALQWVMSSNKPADSATWAGWTAADPFYSYAFEFRGQDDDGYYDAMYDGGLIGGQRVFFNSWTTTFDKVIDAINAVAVTDAFRGVTIVDAADRNAVWKNASALGVCRFYDQNEVTTASPRVRGSQLTYNTALLSTHIVAAVATFTGTFGLTYNDQTVGGLVAAGDVYGWGRYESWWDLFKDLCESLFLKASYTYTRSGGLSAVWSIKPVLETAGASIAYDDSIEEPEITETENAIGKAEVRWETEYPEENKTEFVVNADAARADRSYNVTCILHNSVTHKTVLDEDNAFGDEMVAEPAINQTNLVWFQDGGFITKAHENVRIYWGSGAAEYFDTNETTVSGRPPKDRDQYNLWVIANQAVTGLPFALASAYAALFGQDALATLQLTMPLRGNMTPYVIGTRHAITGDITTDVPHLAWGNAVITEVVTNITDGTQALTFTLIPDPA